MLFSQFSQHLIANCTRHNEPQDIPGEIEGSIGKAELNSIRYSITHRPVLSLSLSPHYPLTLPPLPNTEVFSAKKQVLDFSEAQMLTWIFICSEADRSSRDEFSSFFLSVKVQKKARSDLRGCLEATAASKPHVWELISEIWLFFSQSSKEWKFFWQSSKIIKNSPNILVNPTCLMQPCFQWICPQNNCLKHNKVSCFEVGQSGEWGHAISIFLKN